MIPKLWTIFSVSIEAQHVNPLITKMFTTYNQSLHKSLQIQGESNWCKNTSQFAFINHFNPNISQHLQCLLKSQNTSPLILEIFISYIKHILPKKHTTNGLVLEWSIHTLVQHHVELVVIQQTQSTMLLHDVKICLLWR